MMEGMHSEKNVKYLYWKNKQNSIEFEQFQVVNKYIFF